MPAPSRHAKPKTRTTAARLRAPLVAAAALAGVATAFVSMQGGSASPRPAHDAIPVTNSASAFTGYRLTTTVHQDAATVEARAVQRTAQRKHRAALAATRHAKQVAQQAQQAAAQPTPTPTPSVTPTPAPTPSSGGGDAAHSALGICIRNAEEGGSYAWGPGNGGGAYQFVLGTWEHYGGAAGEFGAAGPAYQDQIFDNAIAAGGASNWTNYDGC
jgi:hypothetical protein